MAKRKPEPRPFHSDLAALSQSIPAPLHLPSLDQDRLEGFAHLFLIVLPQLSAGGEPLFTDSILQELFLVLNDVLARPTDDATRFFTQLKQLLKTAGQVQQQEILISRTDCWLI